MSTQALQWNRPQVGRLVPYQDQNKVPNCQKCGKPMKLLAESDWNYQFGCEACQCAHVYSKPRAKVAAQYAAQLQRSAEREQRRRQHGARPKYFLLGGK